ncbi:MAG: regulatory protein RecX [Dactylosporangium sp.]|nr:regulatory protein RecX [Dactylosporangium sp.]
MATITAVIPSPRREGRFDLMVDGALAATLSLESIERLGLHVGTAMSEPLAAAVAEEAKALHTFDRALDLLAVRARATQELRRALLRKGEEARHVDAAIQRLEALGLLDDAAYARQFARSKIAGPGFSRRRLQAELWKRGVAREVAEAAVAEVLADEELDTDAVIERVAAKKLRTLTRLDADTRRRRLYAFLARRGYDADDIQRVLARALAVEEGEPPPA